MKKSSRKIPQNLKSTYRSLTLPFCILISIFFNAEITQSQVPDAKNNFLSGTKVKDSEDLPPEAQKILSEKSGETLAKESSTGSGSGSSSMQDKVEESGPIPAPAQIEKADIVITKPETIEEQARRIRAEIEEEKKNKKLNIKATPAYSLESGTSVGQSGEGDQVGQPGGGGNGGDGQMAGFEIQKAPTLMERAKLELAEVEAVKSAPIAAGSAGEGGGAGGGSGGGSGSGSGTGEASDAGAAYKAPKTKVCKGKSVYECMASDGEMLERAKLEKAGSEGQAQNPTGYDGEKPYKRVKTKLKTQRELEIEAKKILSGNDQASNQDTIEEGEVSKGDEHSGEVDAPEAPVVSKPKTVEEKANEIKEELNRELMEKRKGSGQGTKDL